jgi:hypothetical protein
LVTLTLGVSALPAGRPWKMRTLASRGAELGAPSSVIRRSKTCVRPSTPASVHATIALPSAAAARSAWLAVRLGSMSIGCASTVHWLV